MSAEVDPANLTVALHRKLYEAREQQMVVWKGERPEFNNADMVGAMNHFVASARGVYPVAETFGRDHVGPEWFTNWRAWWEATLTQNEKRLWDYMHAQRVAREHGDGSDFLTFPISVPRQHTQSELGSALMFRIARQPDPTKDTFRFRRYAEEPASAVCHRFADLCEQFVAAFLSDSAVAALLP